MEAAGKAFAYGLYIAIDDQQLHDLDGQVRSWKAENPDLKFAEVQIRYNDRETSMTYREFLQRMGLLEPSKENI